METSVQIIEREMLPQDFEETTAVVNFTYKTRRIPSYIWTALDAGISVIATSDSDAIVELDKGIIIAEPPKGSGCRSNDKCDREP